MATWGELSKFTWGEVKQKHLTWDDLQKMSYDDLMKLAQLRLEHFNPQTPKEQKIKDVFSQLLLKIAADVASDIIKSVDWSDILRRMIDFLQNNL